MKELNANQDHGDKVLRETTILKKGIICLDCKEDVTQVTARTMQTFNGYCWEEFTQIQVQCQCGNEDWYDIFDTGDTQERIIQLINETVETRLDGFTTKRLEQED